MLTTLLASIAVAASLAEGPPPPITVSLNSGGQYSRGEYAQAQFRASADGYVLLLQADENGRVRVLFPLDPGDDNFIRGGKTYKVVGRDNRGSFYLDQAGSSGMVYAVWSKSPFSYGDFVRGDHWDYAVFDQYNAADDPESQLTDLVLNFTTQGFDYAIDRYVVYSYSEYSSGASTTYIGVSGWPWPSYYAGGWGVGISFGWGYPSYGWGYPAYGWGYPAYGWGYPAYGWGHPGYGYPGGGYYPGYPGGGYYPGYGGGYPGNPGYRPYTFKPGGTGPVAGNPYRPRGDAFAPRSSVFQTGYRDRPTSGVNGADRRVNDAATISGRAEAGRRPASRPTPKVQSTRPRGPTTSQPSGGTTRGATSGTARRPMSGGTTGAAAGSASGGSRRPTTGTAGAAPRARSTAGASTNGAKARGWTSEGKQRPAVSGRPRISPSAPSRARSTSGAAGNNGRSGAASTPSRQPSAGGSRPSAGGSRPSAQPQSRPSGGSRPSAQPQGRSGGSPPAARSGGGSRGGGARGGAPSGGGGGGRRGR